MIPTKRNPPGSREEALYGAYPCPHWRRIVKDEDGEPILEIPLKPGLVDSEQEEDVKFLAAEGLWPRVILRTVRPWDWMRRGHHRLPIYGESPSNRATRDLRHDERFGWWLAEKCNHYFDLTDAIDSERNVARVTIVDVLSLIARGFPSCEIEPNDQDLLEELEEAERAWFKKNGVHDLKCHLAVMPIEEVPHVAGVYFARVQERIKIGMARNVANRLRELQTGAPYRLELLAIAPGGRETESAYHRKFKHLRVQGEWFTSAPELLAEITSLRDAKAEITALRNPPVNRP